MATIVALAAISSFGSRAAEAAVPSPPNSSVPSCFLACPTGDVEYTVIVRDIANVPVANALVRLNLCACPALVFCPGPQGSAACDVLAFSDAAGKATFHVQAGGICPGGIAEVTADGVHLANVPVRTLDLNADLIVNAADAAIVTGLFGQPGGIADLNCSGIVNPDDLALVTQHTVHTCDGPVPAHAASWGQVKTIYR